jgi:UDP-N-acetylmuramoylalanine-D-glutamate ligase
MIDLSPLKEKLGGKPVYIVGLGRSGMPVHEACAAAGIDTLLWDDGEAARKAAEEKGGKLAHPATLDFSTISSLCLSRCSTA